MFIHFDSIGIIIKSIFILNYVISSCKLADFGLARSLSQNHPTVDSNGNEEACLTDYVGNANRFNCYRDTMMWLVFFFQMKSHHGSLAQI